MSDEKEIKALRARVKHLEERLDEYGLLDMDENKVFWVPYNELLKPLMIPLQGELRKAMRAFVEKGFLFVEGGEREAEVTFCLEDPLYDIEHRVSLSEILKEGYETFDPDEGRWPGWNARLFEALNTAYEKFVAENPKPSEEQEG